MPTEIPRDYLDRVLGDLWRRAPGAMIRLVGGDPDLATPIHTQPTLVKRPADAAARVAHPDGDYILHVEFETAARQEVLRRAALYGLVFHDATGCPVRSTVVLLERAPPLAAGFSMRHGADLLCSYRVEQFPLYQVAPERLAADADLAVLTPFAERTRLAHIAAAAATLRASGPRDGREDALAALYLLGGRRFPHSQLIRTLPEEELMVSATYEYVLNKGVERGLQQGVQQGVQQGIEQGERRGLDRLRAVLLRQIALRFPSSSLDFSILIGKASTDTLDQISEAVMLASSPEDLYDAAVRLLAGPGEDRR